MSETPETTEPVDVPFIKPVTIEQTGPELRLRVADLEEWLRSLPIDYPDELNRCAETSWKRFTTWRRHDLLSTHEGW